MKTKIYKILGVALTVVLMASLTVGLATVPAGAASSTLKFTKLELPKIDLGATDNATAFADTEGDFWCTPGADLGPIARTPDGDILFAAVADGFYLASGWFHVLKSNDGGYSWTVTGFYDEADDNSDYSYIVDIVTSPEYDDDTTLAVATRDYVYISDDGGKNFVVLADPGWTGYITDLDMTISEDGDLAIVVGTSTGGAGGELWVAKGLLAWTDQVIGTYDVLACAFLPTFAADGDIGIAAIVTEYTYVPSGDPAPNGSTLMRFSFADVSLGTGEWGDDIADAPFTNAEGYHFPSDWGRIAFPDDFDAFGIGNNVCFAGIVEDGFFGDTSLPTENGSDAYKVICKEAGTSSAIDLDVRGVLTTLLPTATAITSIDVCGDADEATILVGTDAINLADTPMYFSSYLSEDSGDSWAASAKCPTGGAENLTPGDIEFEHAMTRVLMGPEFCDDGLAYASTWGYKTDAFQRTTDFGESWNQISLVDYGADGEYWITAFGFNAFGYNANDTLWMITSEVEMPMMWASVQNGALWGRLDGKHWERILSYATPGVTDQLFQLGIVMDGSAMFATDMMAEKIWRSTDMGATWPKAISTKGGLQFVWPVSSTTLYTSHDASAANGSGIWWTERSGTGWEKPEDSDIPSTAVVASAAAMGDIVYAGTWAGAVYISSDGGENVERVGKTGPFDTMVMAGLDMGFFENGIMYAVSPPTGPDGGVERCEVDLDDPSDAEWVRIDEYQDSTNNIGDTDDYYPEANFTAASPPFALPPSGILYIGDGTAVNKDYTTSPAVNAGGLWRSTNPTDDIDSVTPPYFERENKGLDENDVIGVRSFDFSPTMAPTFFCAVSNYDGGPPTDPNLTPYYDQIVMFTDILNVGVPLVTPEDDATGVGLLPENWVGDVYPAVTFAWEEMAGATGYQYQVSIDPDFKTKVLSGFTDDLGVLVDNWLLSNTTYYWRVRVADEGSLIGAPLISPWSPTYSFKTAIGPAMQRPNLQAPAAGASDVPLSPTFEWSGIEWAEVYEYELALDPSTTAGGYFSTPLVSLVGTDALVSTAWKCNITLDYETRYYWQVKAIGVDTETPWSDVGTFTTMGVPPPPPETAPPIEIPPTQQITPAWIWAVVIIGAILVIAVIVLIVTTRRVP